MISQWKSEIFRNFVSYFGGGKGFTFANYCSMLGELVTVVTQPGPHCPLTTKHADHNRLWVFKTDHVRSNNKEEVCVCAETK